MTSTERRIENVPTVPQNVPDGRDGSPDYLESEPSQPSRRLVISGGRTGRTDGVPQSKKGRHPRPDREVSNTDAPRVLLTIAEAKRLLDLASRSLLTDRDEIDLVTDLVAILNRARAIQARKAA